MKLETVAVKIPEDCNIIIGQSHFIKTVEDLHEVMIQQVAQVKFGLAFCEASGECLVRHSGNDEYLQAVAQKNALELGAGTQLYYFVEKCLSDELSQHHQTSS